jgi:hypothetical protein
MFKEILHYTFRRAGAAFDISAFHQHGHPSGVGFSKDGAAPNSGAVVFNGQSGRVSVPFGEVWQELGAVKVEALVRLDGLGVRQNLVEGFLSFALFVRGDGVVTGSYLAPKQMGGSPFAASNSLVGTVLGGGGSPDPFSTLGATPPDSEEPEVELTWTGVNSDSEFAPDGLKRTVAPGVWTHVTFLHNGFSLQLWLEGELAGYRDDIRSGVLGVQPGGVHIGAWPSSNKYVLKGALDEIRIWKLDPFSREERFFCRPMDGRTEVCWRELLRRIMLQWEDPETSARVEKVLDCLYEAELDLLRAIHRQGAQAINEFRTFGRRYDELWCEGKIDGPEMAELVRNFGEWIQDTAGAAFDDHIAKYFMCRQDLLTLASDDELKCIADCDAGWQGLIKLIGEHALPGICSPPSRSASTEPERPYSSKHRY